MLSWIADAAATLEAQPAANRQHVIWGTDDKVDETYSSGSSETTHLLLATLTHGNSSTCTVLSNLLQQALHDNAMWINKVAELFRFRIH